MVKVARINNFSLGKPYGTTIQYGEGNSVAYVMKVNPDGETGDPVESYSLKSHGPGFADAARHRAKCLNEAYEADRATCDDPGAHRPGCQCNGGEPRL